jgi:lipopolysaccharide assembly outer membrane protein LptD (OstA)
MFRRLMAMFVVAMFIGIATLAHGQQTGIGFGRFGDIPGGRGTTTFTGRADRTEYVGGVTTHRGNVSIFFENSHLLVQADEVAYAESSNEWTLSGNVRLKLDTTGLPY